MQHTSWSPPQRNALSPRTRSGAPSPRTRTSRRAGSASQNAPSDAARRRRSYDAVVSQWLMEQTSGRDPLRPFVLYPTSSRTPGREEVTD